MAPPVWSVGQVLTASDVNTWFVPLAVYKTADLGRTSTSLTADPDLTVTVAANAVYSVDAALFYKGSTTSAQFQWTWTIPAGAGSGSYHASYIGGGGGAVIEGDGWTDAAHTAGIPVANNVQGLRVGGTLGTGGSSGSFTLNWALSGTGTSTLVTRSRLVLFRIG